MVKYICGRGQNLFPFSHMKTSTKDAIENEMMANGKNIHMLTIKDEPSDWKTCFVDDK